MLGPRAVCCEPGTCPGPSCGICYKQREPDSDEEWQRKHDEQQRTHRRKKRSREAAAVQRQVPCNISHATRGNGACKWIMWRCKHSDVMRLRQPLLDGVSYAPAPGNSTGKIRNVTCDAWLLGVIDCVRTLKHALCLLSLFPLFSLAFFSF